MDSINWALIINGRVDNILWWNGDLDLYTPPDGSSTVPVPLELVGILSIGWLYDGNVFTDPNAPTPQQALATAKTEQIAALSQACQDHIYSGFSSVALGTAHNYPANDHSQINLVGAVTSSLYPSLDISWTTSFMCEDSTGIWNRVPHTAAQIQQVGTDGKAAIDAALDKNLLLANEVSAATTIADVKAVVWVFP